ERHQARVPHGTGDVARIADFAAIADVVDDDAAASGLHARIVEPRQVYVAEDLQLPSRAPLFRIDVEERAGGNRAGVVDEDVDVTGRRCNALRASRLRQVARDQLDAALRKALAERGL